LTFFAIDTSLVVVTINFSRRKWKMKKMLIIYACVLVMTNICPADSIVIPSSAFICDSGYDAEAYFYRFAYLAVYPGSTYRGFSAPVNLPDGARVTSVVVFYKDYSSGYGIIVSLLRQNLYHNNADFQNMANFSSSGSANIWAKAKINPISYGLINNGGYAYRMSISFSGAPAFYQDMAVKAIKIIYDPPSQ